MFTNFNSLKGSIIISLFTILVACGGGEENGTAPASLANNGNLSNLTVSVGALIPHFNNNILNYSVNVANGITSTTLTATLTSAAAVLTINGVNETSGVRSSTINLIAGSNRINVVVISADAKITKAYTIMVIRAGLPGNDSSANLTRLAILSVG